MMSRRNDGRAALKCGDRPGFRIGDISNDAVNQRRGIQQSAREGMPGDFRSIECTYTND
jgi:hypothetical protein